jgi:heme exporter protein CcmD
MDASFWQMSGYASFVWSSFGVSAVVFAWNWMAPRLHRQRLLEAIRDSGEES